MPIEMIEEFDRRNDGLYDASFKAQALSGAMMPAMQFVQYLTYVLIAVVGALKVTAGQMTLGDVTGSLGVVSEIEVDDRALGAELRAMIREYRFDAVLDRIGLGK